MHYFRVKPFFDDGSIMSDYTGILYAVEFTKNNGKSWSIMSTHLSPEGAEKKLLSQYGVDFELDPQLQKSLVALIQERQNGSGLLDCLESEALSSIHASFHAGLLTNAQAELLENRFVFASEDPHAQTDTSREGIRV